VKHPTELFESTTNAYTLAYEHGYVVSRKQVRMKGGVRTVWPFLISSEGEVVARLTHFHTPDGIRYRWKPQRP
jgi:hypothetical protein